MAERIETQPEVEEEALREEAPSGAHKIGLFNRDQPEEPGTPRGGVRNQPVGNQAEEDEREQLEKTAEAGEIPGRDAGPTD